MKDLSKPKQGNAASGKAVDVRRLAARTALSLSSSETSLEAILSSTALSASSLSLSDDWVRQELDCARAFNFELPNDPVAALDRIEETLRDLTATRRCAILSFNEQTGTYTCLDDLRQPNGKVRETNRISDWFLQEVFGSGQEILYTYLVSENGLTGVAIVGEKASEVPFTADDQRLLDTLAPYLAVQLDRLNSLKEAIAEPDLQRVNLELAEKLVTAVDQESILSVTLEILANRLGFEACQYVAYSADSGTGEVLYEIKNANSQSRKLSSYSHAGLEGKRRVIQDFSNLVGLLNSVARNRFYLHLDGKKLGERSLGEIFGIRNIQTAVLLPVTDVATGEILGTINLFRTTANRISEEQREIGIEAARLASYALSRAQVLDKALAMASSDELTKLINRRGYYQRFEAELERARRHQIPLCVALIDVDHFKRFNDTYGHLSGDLILKSLADLFTQNMRKSDVVCRFGGEEFAILLPDTSLKAAIDLMERVRQNVEALQIPGFHGETLHVTISIGLAEVDSKPKASLHCSEISEALAQADEQLYLAKNNGRNRVCYVEPSTVISHAG